MFLNNTHESVELDEVPVIHKKLSAFCGEYSNSTRIDERLGVLGNECFLNGLSFVPNIVFVLIAIPVLISWNKSIFASMHVKTWVRFPYHVLRWILFVILLYVNVLEILAGFLSDELLGGAHLHLFIPHIASVAGTLVAVVYYHSVEMWNSPRFLLLLIPYWFFLMVVETMKTLNLKLLDVSAMYMRPHFTRSSIIIYLLLLLIELDILRQIRYAFFTKKRALKAPDYLANTNYVHSGVSLPSKATFFWLRSLINQSLKKPLEAADLGALPKREKSGYNYAQLLACIEEEKDRKSHGEQLWVSMLKSCLMKSQGMLLTVLTFSLIGSLLHLSTPVLLLHLIKCLDNQNKTRKLNATELPNEGDMVEVTEFFSNGYVIALLFFLCGILASTFNQAANFLAMREGVRMRGSMQLLIYSKVLSLSLWNFGSKATSSTQIANHLTTDCNNLHMCYCVVHLFIVLPIKCLLACILLYVFLGASSLLALLVLILLILLQCVLVKRLQKSQNTITELADERVRRCTEMLQNIKCLKLYSWESIAADEVLKSRKRQIEAMKKVSLIRSVSSMITDSAHLVILIIVFITYGLTKNLTHVEAFPSIVTVEIITSSVHLLPYLYTFLSRAYVSNQLITSFLTSFEIDSNSHQSEQSKFHEVKKYQSLVESDSQDKASSDQDGEKVKRVSRKSKVAEEICLKDMGQKSRPSHSSRTIERCLLDVETNKGRDLRDSRDRKDKKESESLLEVKTRHGHTPSSRKGKEKGSSQNQTPAAGLISASNSVGSGLDDDDLIDPNRDVGVAVTVSHGLFSWSPADQEALLNDINFKADAGLLTLIVGDKGSGKSSLVSAILGEMNKLKGTVSWKHGLTTCYAGSTPWILNNTVQENIIFGQPMEKKRYKRVLKACALNVDIDILPEKDSTIIGEKGIVLNPGQKLRITIARAIYSKADLVILDDPFSGLDLATASHIFEDAILYFCLLRRRRTVILVTHQLHFLPFAHAIYQVEDGCLKFHGRLHEVKQHNPQLFTIWQQGVKKARRENKIRTDREDTTNTERLMLLRKIRTHEFRRELVQGLSEEESKRVHFTSQTAQLPIESENSATGEVVAFDNDDTASPFEEKANVENIIIRGGLLRRKRQENLLMLTTETKIPLSNVRFSFAALWYYITSMSLPVFFCFLLLHIARAIFVFYADIQLTHWCFYSKRYKMHLMNNQTPILKDQNESQDHLEMYFILCGSALILSLAALFFKEIFHLRSSSIIYSKVLARVVKASMKFFDSNPISKIITRLSGDIGIIDEKLPTILEQVIKTSLIIFSCFYINVYVNIFFLPCAILLMFVILFYVFTYVRAYREVHKLESASKIPLMSHISETLQGLKSIRAFKKEIHFWAEMESFVNDSNCAHLWMHSLNRWISIRMDFTACLMVLMSCVLSIAAGVEPSFIALAIAYILMVGNYLNFMVKSFSEVDASSPAIQRLHEYSTLPSEEENDESISPENWPSSGEIDFQNVSITYPSQPTPVTKNISFHINSGEKVGICGKPGSGKSSLILSLFGMVEVSEGSIEIDNVEISTVNKGYLRSRLALLPQDCMLLQGTIRYNLDPKGLQTDGQIWECLEKVEMKTSVQELDDGLETHVLEGGENFSVTEKQLLCIARAILRESKIVIIDEVMSVLNEKTEQVLNKVLKECFEGKTVINLSHRPASLLEYDKVLVLDNGSVVEEGNPSELVASETGVFVSLLKKKP